MWKLDVAWRIVYTLAFRVVRALVIGLRPGTADALQMLGGSGMQGQLPLFDDGGKPAPDLAQEPVPTALAGDAVPLPSIDEVVRDLATKQARLSQYIESCLKEGVDVSELTRLFALHGQNASRLGRLLRDRLVLAGEAGDMISEAIALALDELEQELGVKL